jgi:hypothetical protein
MATNPQKKHFTFTIRDFYKDYVKECRESKEFEKRDYKKYRDFIYDIFAEIFKKIVHDSWHFVLPYSLGELYIKNVTVAAGAKVYSRALTFKNKKATFVLNNHTLRETFKFKWDKTFTRFNNSKFYSFDILPGRNNLHKKYKVGSKFLSEHYFEINKDPNKNVPKPYNKAIKKIEEVKYKDDECQ